MSAEDYLAVLAELSPREIIVARAVFAQQREKPGLDSAPFAAERPRRKDDTDEDDNWLKMGDASGLGEPSRAVPCTVPEEDLPFVLLHLQRSGLVNELAGGYIGYTGGVYIVTDTFRKLMAFMGSSGLTPFARQFRFIPPPPTHSPGAQQPVRPAIPFAGRGCPATLLPHLRLQHLTPGRTARTAAYGAMELRGTCAWQSICLANMEAPDHPITAHPNAPPPTHNPGVLVHRTYGGQARAGDP